MGAGALFEVIVDLGSLALWRLVAATGGERSMLLKRFWGGRGVDSLAVLAFLRHDVDVLVLFGYEDFRELLHGKF